jgi:hypothetical protein
MVRVSGLSRKNWSRGRRFCAKIGQTGQLSFRLNSPRNCGGSPRNCGNSRITWWTKVASQPKNCMKINKKKNRIKRGDMKTVTWSKEAHHRQSFLLTPSVFSVTIKYIITLLCCYSLYSFVQRREEMLYKYGEPDCKHVLPELMLMCLILA